MPHIATLSALFIALLVAIAIAYFGQFQIYNSQGILSGPFSALLLIGAAVAALFLLVALDWRIWQPRRIARALHLSRWLAKDVFGIDSEIAANWQTLQGDFRGRKISLARVPGGVAWSAETSFNSDLAVVRQPDKKRSPADTGEFSTGDADFDECYLWQSLQPNAMTAQLRNPEMRAILKRLATLIAPHGVLSRASAGVRVAENRIVLVQTPAPWLRGNEFAAEEVLLILDDLCRFAELLEGGKSTPPAVIAGESRDGDASRSASFPWWAFVLAGLFAISVWLLGTWALARVFGMSAAMVGFFIPPLMLALLFIYASASSSGRDHDLEEYLEKEASELLRKRSDLQSFKSKLTP